MKSAAYGLAEMLASFGINPNSPLPTLIAGRNLIMGQRVKLEESALKVEGISGLVDLVNFLGNLDSAIRQRSIGSEGPIIYDKNNDAVYLNYEGKLRFVDLTPDERAVLKYLMEHPGERLKPSSIADGADLRNVIHLSRYIKNIMRKLSDTDPHQPKYIKIEGETKGRAYKFIASQSTPHASQYYYISVPTAQ